MIAGNVDEQYLSILQEILRDGDDKGDRTGTGTYMIPGAEIKVDLADGFPLLTTKAVHIRSIIYELLWFLSGDTNIKYLKEKKVKIWNEWADENGELGPVYGAQWRSWLARNGEKIDQISRLINRLITDPNSRRHLVSAWNVGDIEQGLPALPPCHCLFQFYFYKERLHLTLYQRSCDIFIGVPFNIASYASLLLMTSQVVKSVPGTFRWIGGDVHLYKNHVEQARLQLQREPRPLPVMRLNPEVKSIFDFKYEDFSLEGYNPHPPIKADISV